MVVKEYRKPDPLRKMIASSVRFLLISLLWLIAGSLPASVARAPGETALAGGTLQKPAEADEQPLPKEVMGFQGKVTGTVVAVDGAKSVMTMKVVKAEPHPASNRAPKPEALHGMTITVTPLDVRPKEGPAVPEAKAAAYIAGAMAGDAVTIDVRSSSKGVVFRLLRVPTAGKK
jgi:hypothetical protein